MAVGDDLAYGSAAVLGAGLVAGIYKGRQALKAGDSWSMQKTRVYEGKAPVDAAEQRARTDLKGDINAIWSGEPFSRQNLQLSPDGVSPQNLKESLLKASRGGSELGGLARKVGEISGVIDEGDAPTESACTFDQMVESLSVMSCPEKCTRPQLCNLIPSCNH